MMMIGHWKELSRERLTFLSTCFHFPFVSIVVYTSLTLADSFDFSSSNEFGVGKNYGASARASYHVNCKRYKWHSVLKGSERAR